MQYKEQLPSPVLQPYVECFWYHAIDTEQPLEHQPVRACVPLGCLDLIVEVNTQPCILYNRENQLWENGVNMFVVGMSTNASIWRGKPNAYTFGIRMKPENMMALFKLPAATIFNTIADGATLLGKTATQMAEEMYGNMNFAQLITIAEKHLIRLAARARTERTYLSEACRLIRNNPDTISMKNLCGHLYISPRQLQRGFKELMGTSPKTFQRIIRFRKAYSYTKKMADKDIKWADLSYELGYADQAHFIRDFKEFSGEIPSHVAASGQSFFQTLQPQ